MFSRPMLGIVIISSCNFNLFLKRRFTVCYHLLNLKVFLVSVILDTYIFKMICNELNYTWKDRVPDLSSLYMSGDAEYPALENSRSGRVCSRTMQ